MPLGQFPTASISFCAHDICLNVCFKNNFLIVSLKGLSFAVWCEAWTTQHMIFETNIWNEFVSSSHYMMTSSNGTLFWRYWPFVRVNLTGEFSPRNVSNFFGVVPNKPLNKQSNDRWFETMGRSCYVIVMVFVIFTSFPAHTRTFTVHTVFNCDRYFEWHVESIY